VEIKPLGPFDYAHVSAWWQAQNWPVIPQEMLPSTGLIVESEGEKLAAGFLYKTDSKIAWLEFLVGNPESDKMKRRQALDALIQGLCDEARESGFTRIFTSAQHPGLIERYKGHGFMETDKNMTNLVRVV
jgi:hypothetical protein